MANKTFADISDTTSVAPTDTTLIWNGSANKETTAADFIKSYGSTTELTSVDTANDKIPVIDDTDGDLKWVKPSNLGAGGDTTPYRISVTVASNNITLALKDKNGNDPSVDSPVKVQIGDTVREVTSALSVTKNAGTNWCNSGSAELATKEVDYFAYLGYNATDGVVIGFSRIPSARIYSDFSTTTTNEKYAAISTITNAASSDAYTVIGRFAATLSAGAGYTWSVPTFTAANLVHNPINTTRPLSYVPQFTNLTVGNGTLSSEYNIKGNEISFWIVLTFGSTTAISGAVTITLPFSRRAYGVSTRQSNGLVRLTDTGTAAYAGLVAMDTTSANIVAQNAAGTYLAQAGLSSTVPFTWTTGDEILIDGVRYDI